MKKKIIALVASLALVASVGAGATLAYLTDSTETVTNTFTVGKVDVNIAETGAVDGAKAYTNVLPGDVLSKDPSVTLADDSEDAYVFVKISDNAAAVTWTLASGWTRYENTDVYYRTVLNTDETKTFAVFANNQVTVSTSLVEAQVTEDRVLGSIAIKAAAVQLRNVASVADAYGLVENFFNN